MSGAAFDIGRESRPGFRCGGWTPYRFELIKSVYGHYSHQERLITDPAIRSFSGWSEITEHTKAANGESLDQELAAAVRFVEKHGYNTTSVLDRIVDSAGSPQETAVSFSTIHRAKGLEWPFVTMLDDFPSKRNEKGKIEIPSREELNLLYVAVTRACFGWKSTARFPSSWTCRMLELPDCPREGEGERHGWIMGAANRCARHYLSESVRIIRERLTREPSPANEIESAVHKAFSQALDEQVFWQSLRKSGAGRQAPAASLDGGSVLSESEQAALARASSRSRWPSFRAPNAEVILKICDMGIITFAVNGAHARGLHLRGLLERRAGMGGLRS